MSDVPFTCSCCGQSLEAPEDMAGTEIECPQCKKQIMIPTQSSPKERSIARVEWPQKTAPSIPEPSLQADGPNGSETERGRDRSHDLVCRSPTWGTGLLVAFGVLLLALNATVLVGQHRIVSRFAALEYDLDDAWTELRAGNIKLTTIEPAVLGMKDDTSQIVLTAANATDQTVLTAANATDRTIAVLRREIADLELAMTAMTRSLSSVQSDVSSIESDVSSIESDVSSIQSDVSSIDSYVVQIYNEVN